MRLTRIAALCMALSPATALAAPYTGFTVFGDSLSDRGNLAETGFLQAAANQPVTMNFPNPPSNHDSFTNGPVAVQGLAQSLGFNADPSLFVTGFQDIHNLFGGPSYIPGGNYAVAGATASALPLAGGVPGANLPQQVAAYLSTTAGAASATALYVVMIGGNDVRNAAYTAGGTEVSQGVASELGVIKALLAAGARNLLVVNVPDVGAIPEAKALDSTTAALATTYSQAYNAGLAGGIAGLTKPAGANITQFDLYSYNAIIASNPGAFGLTNTTDPCFIATPVSPAATPACGGTGGPKVNSFEYWDSIHPSGTVQALWAGGMEQALAGQTPNPFNVPEPASAALVGAGLLALAGWRLRVTLHPVPPRDQDSAPGG